jgi:hypothetical protein
LFSLHGFCLSMVWFVFGFSPACSCFAGSCAKALSRPQTRHGCAAFFDRLRPCCKKSFGR